MADGHYGDDVAILKSIPLPVLSDVSGSVHHGIVANALVSPDEQVAVLTLLEESGGSAPLADCAAVLADHPRPIAALIGLAEAGLVTLDQHAAFDANCIVTRVLPARA